MKRLSICLIVAVLLIVLLTAATSNWQERTIIYFKPNTTLEQAVLGLRPIEPGIVKRLMANANHYNPDTDNIVSIYSRNGLQHWRYLDWAIRELPGSIASAPADHADPQHIAELERMYQNALKEKTDDPQHINGCWERNDCPPILVDEVHMIITSANKPAILALPFVDHLQAPTNLGEAVFFWTCRLQLNLKIASYQTLCR